MNNADFETWWYNEGSGIRPIDTHDHAEHIYRMCKVAWELGEQAAKQGEQQ